MYFFGELMQSAHCIDYNKKNRFIKKEQPKQLLRNLGFKFLEAKVPILSNISFLISLSMTRIKNCLYSDFY